MRSEATLAHAALAGNAGAWMVSTGGRIGSRTETFEARPCSCSAPRLQWPRPHTFRRVILYMRKLLLPIALIGALAVPSAASAANVYDITASFSPSKSGTKKKPKAVSGKFGFRVTETEDRRPAALDKLTASFT